MSQLTFDLNAASILLDSSEPFPVDFDRAWEWLGFTRKDNAKTSLLNSGFIADADYKISILNNKELGTLDNPRPREVIHLTIEAFKTWGMMAGTEQGKLVRKYFLECERVAKAGITTIELWQLAVQQSQQIDLQNQKIDLLQSEVADLSKIVANNAKALTHVNDLAHDTSRLVDRLLDRNVQLQGELDRLNHPYGKYYTVYGYLNVPDLTSEKIRQLAPSEIAHIGKLCAIQCEKRRITVEKVHDMRYGTVGAYPETIIQNCIPHDFYI